MLPILASIAAPVVTSALTGMVQNFLSGSGGASAAGGPGGSLFGALTSAFAPLFGQIAKNPLVSSFLSPSPALFSTAGMSQQSLDDPMSRLRPSMNLLADTSAIVRDHRSDAGGSPIVRDHRADSGGVIVRDHRTTSTSGGSTPGPVYGGSGSSVLSQLQGEADRAKQALMADPKNAAKALEAQEAMQALQTIAQLLMQDNSIKASIASQALQSAKVN